MLSSIVPVVVGEKEAGRSAKVRATLESLIKNVSKSTFDIAELLSEVRGKGYYYNWGFNTFKEYVAGLDIKQRKAQYLARIVDVMEDIGVSRAEYEPVGLSKLREITSLDPLQDYVDPNDANKITPMSELILGLTRKARDLSLDEIKETVRTLKGLTGENDLVWMNICLTKSAKENTVDPAFELAKKNIGTLGYDDDGEGVDASDGKALEMIAVEYLNDPANQFLGENG